jgi:hypothetical protein
MDLIALMSNLFPEHPIFSFTCTALFTTDISLIPTPGIKTVEENPYR